MVATAVAPTAAVVPAATAVAFAVEARVAVMGGEEGDMWATTLILVIIILPINRYPWTATNEQEGDVKMTEG